MRPIAHGTGRGVLYETDVPVRDWCPWNGSRATGSGRHPRAQVGDVAARLGVGERQLLRRCRAAAGYGPATLRRVLRFRRFVARVDAGEGRPGGPDLARLAADTGYADQAHLTHECARLAGLPPAALTVERRPAAA